jgi:hypothetical protein
MNILFSNSSLIEKCKDLKDFSGYSLEPDFATYSGGYLYSVPIWSYKILYTIDESQVNVLDVISGKKNPKDIIML